ncbi:uncharacterized protein LOC111718190 [Eurytemora carolleeae]|uniref:uncharacterized protein LOC111718190 n=1 Tax=Eurytemora carolleeae TaxID=1294199 RepID=UPI000C760E97|nr:uncharacterized protein LOC111718190 [Eurytemora carolleeae]|eukprot:XP_023349485.1 uncharacterized protein LOC111718190 [Eurytemora affinis]
MNLLVCFGVALCLEAIKSQEFDYGEEYDYVEEEEEGFPMDENAPAAVGIFAFLTYIAVDNLSRLVHLLTRKPIPEYKDCGRRNPKIEEFETNNADALDIVRTLEDNFCTDKCFFRDTSLRYDYSFDTVAFGNQTRVRVLIQPNRKCGNIHLLAKEFLFLPLKKASCTYLFSVKVKFCAIQLRKCKQTLAQFSQLHSDWKNQNFFSDDFRTFCNAQNNSQLDCLILDGAVPVENNQTSASRVQDMFFTPTTEEEVVMSYCFAEIFGDTTLRGISPDVASVTEQLFTKSTFCKNLCKYK